MLAQPLRYEDISCRAPDPRDNYLGQLFHLDKHARSLSNIFPPLLVNTSFVRVSLFLSLSTRENSLDISLSIAALLSDDRPCTAHLYKL